MTNDSPGSDEGKTPRSPAGIKAESESVNKFESLLNRQADILAEQRNSKEKSDSDYHQSFQQLVTPPKKGLTTQEVIAKACMAIGGYLIGAGTLSNYPEFIIDWPHVVGGGVILTAGIYLERK